MEGDDYTLSLGALYFLESGESIVDLYYCTARDRKHLSYFALLLEQAFMLDAIALFKIRLS